MFLILSIVAGLVYSTAAELNPLKCRVEGVSDLSAISDSNETCWVKSEFHGLVLEGASDIIFKPARFKRFFRRQSWLHESPSTTKVCSQLNVFIFFHFCRGCACTV